MRMKRLIGLLLALALACSMVTLSLAEEEEAGWWAQEYWDLETLTGLGAVPPTYNAAEKRYEIAAPEQLLFLSGEWKTADTNGDGVPDAPRDGYYVLTADLDMAPLMKKLGQALTKASGAATEGYMPPISANKENKKNPDDGYFQGSFDGQNHAISNLHIARMDGEYVGLFGYAGYKTADKHAYIRNLALIDIQVVGVEDCGTLAGGSYADIDNVMVVGSVKGVTGVGGLTSTNKSGGGDNVGHVTNCFVLVVVECEDEEAGGLHSKIAGYVGNCFVAGLVATDGAFQYAGGLAGAYDAGAGVENNAVAVCGLISAQGGKYVGPLFGSLDGDSGRSLKNNLVFDGMTLTGNPDYSHPAQATETPVSYGTLIRKATYTDSLGWDFENVWEWVGQEDGGYPLLKAFDRFAGQISLDKRLKATFSFSAPALSADNPPLTAANAGEEVGITAKFVPSINGGESADTVTLWYGGGEDASAFTSSVPMTAGEDGLWSCVFPETAEGEYHYCIRAAYSGGEISYPYDTSKAIPLTLSVPVLDGTPRDLTVSPGTDQTRIGFNFLTNPEAAEGQLRYRVQGTEEWTTMDCVSYLSYVDEGWDEVYSHWADAEGLTPATAYEYQAIGLVEGQAYEGEVLTFTTMPDDGTVKMMFFSDLESDDEDGYENLVETYSQFVLPKLGTPDFLLSTGDNVQDSFKTAQWDTLFGVCGELLSTNLNVLLPGNSEHSGDLFYRNYTARTNLPGGYDDEVIGEYTGWMKAGDVCFVFINTEVFTENGTDDRAAYYEKQKAWAEEIFNNSGCTWRVVATHRGPYTTDHNGLADVPELLDICKDLYVDLFLNGHDHSYIRVTALDGVKKEPGQATTYLTTSAIGEKLDDYGEGLIDELVAVHVGSSDREQQKFGYLTVDDGGMHVTIYERGEEEDFSNYSVIDSFDIPESLSLQAGVVEKKTPAPQTETQDGEQAPGEAEAQETASKPNTLLIVIIAAAVIGVFALIVALNRKASKQDK